MAIKDLAELLPDLGDIFYDDHGRLWSIDEIRVLSGSPAGENFVVRVAFRTPKGHTASYVMTPLEFRTLALKSGLKPRHLH